MITQTAEYALRAVLYLARQGDEELVSVETVAAEVGIPRNYLSKILHTLAKEGVLESLRGPRGGFKLAIEAERLPLVRVVEPFDHLTERRSCLLGRPECSDESPCAAHHRWKAMADQVTGFFEETTIRHLTDSERFQEGEPSDDARTAAGGRG